MDASAVDRVLACRNLPSLPGVALQVVEFTRDAGVPIDKIAKLVQNDPALTAKILRTVNSSYYGLSNPCPTISRAVSLLGLNTVKSLVLGFSLVEMTGGADKKGFDLTSYWRRTIYSAAGARLLAKRVRRCDPEEAFIGALLQDVGMLATHAALGDAYVRVLAMAPDDHDELSKTEMTALGFDHASVGSKLMEKWKLPPQVIECTRRHHQPDQADPAHAVLVQLVALGMDAAAAMTLPAPRPRLARFTTRAMEWFGIPRDEIDGLLQDIAEGAAQLSSLLRTPTGNRPDVAELLADANEQLTMHQIEVEHAADSLQQSNKELARQVATDALTGAANRKQFDSEVGIRFEEATRAGSSLAVLFTDADKFKSVNDTHGHQAGDVVLIEIARRLRESTGERGTVCRYGGEEFAIILPGVTAKQAESIAQGLRLAIESKPVDIAALKLAVGELRITISIGIAATDQGGFETAAKLVHAADEAVYVAKRAGRNCVRMAAGPGQKPTARQTPRETGPTPPTAAGRVRVMLVEDDPLAAKLIELLFDKRPEIHMETVGSAEEALKSLAGRASLPNVLLCDLSLPGMSGVDLIRTLRSDSAWREIPILAICGSADGAESSVTLGAGADAFATKAQLCSNFGKWVAMVVGMGAKPRVAA